MKDRAKAAQKEYVTAATRTGNLANNTRQPDGIDAEVLQVIGTDFDCTAFEELGVPPLKRKSLATVNDGNSLESAEKVLKTATFRKNSHQKGITHYLNGKITFNGLIFNLFSVHKPSVAKSLLTTTTTQASLLNRNAIPTTQQYPGFLNVPVKKSDGMFCQHIVHNPIIPVQ